jgi:hypothetical protein
MTAPYQPHRVGINETFPLKSLLVLFYTIRSYTWLPPMNHIAFFPRLKCFFALLLLMIADIVPIPILGLICMFILLFRPRWFKDLVDTIYAVESGTDKQ